MAVTRFTKRDGGSIIEAELVIVGAGPVGLSIADRCSREGIDVLLLESGLEHEDGAHEALNEVIAAVDAIDSGQAERRSKYHGPQAPLWSAARQAYGVRCRGLGGSTQAWAGKVAQFDEIDFAVRSWVPNSGWPVGREELHPYLDQARELLGLCPIEPPQRFSDAGLRSCYWQFARSRSDRLDVMRFGRDFAPGLPPKMRVLLDATVTRLGFDRTSEAIHELQIASLAGASAIVRPKRVVLAAGGVENARLLLDSNDIESGGVGNRHDTVGRYLIDHAGLTLGQVEGPGNIAMLARKFGFYGLSDAGRSHMFMHGLALSPATQREEELLNAAIIFAPQRAPDDPFDALKRLMRGHDERRLSDVVTAMRGIGLIARGVGARALSGHHAPERLKELIVGTAIRFAPNMVADEFVSGGLPHKLTGLSVDAVAEVAPHPTNRITLSGRQDALGRRVAAAHWTVGSMEWRTLTALANCLEPAMTAAGIPVPTLAGWVKDACLARPSPIDLAHTMGTTRMAADPRRGVVDSDCRVFGLSNLYIAGGSVFPTGGHANPTWMFLALALRLADHLAATTGRLIGAGSRNTASLN
jgi:choline dehydrogenase-like flavoprotein